MVFGNFSRDKYWSKFGSDQRILDFELEILRDAELFLAQEQDPGVYILLNDMVVGGWVI